MDSTKLKRLEKLAKIIDSGNVGIFDYLTEIEDKLDREIPAIKDVLARIKGDKGDTPTAEEILAVISPYIDEIRKSVKNGEDYILTEQDKKDIASTIKVPVVEKVVEKTEVIKEQPIVKTEIVKETVKEIDEKKLESLIPKYNESVRNGLELLEGDSRLDKKAIRGLDDYEEVARLAKTPKTINGGGSIARNFYQLFDVPQSYAGQGGKGIRVKSDESGLEFFAGEGLVDWGEIGGTLTDQTDLQAALNERGQTVSATLTYDGNNLTGIEYANGDTISFTYDGVNISTKTVTVNGVSKTYTYGYDGSNISSITVS